MPTAHHILPPPHEELAPMPGAALVAQPQGSEDNRLDQTVALAIRAQLDFYIEAKAVNHEPNVTILVNNVARIYDQYLRRDAPRSIMCISESMRESLQASACYGKLHELERLSPSTLRHMYDVAAQMCLKTVESDSLAAFMASPHYKYVLALKAKEGHDLKMHDFKAVRLLGQGGFGQVIEVIKRDCGKHYAMKVMARPYASSKVGKKKLRRGSAFSMEAINILPDLFHFLFFFESHFRLN